MNGTGCLSKAVIRVIVDPFLKAFSMSALLYGLIEAFTESVPNCGYRVLLLRFASL